MSKLRKERPTVLNDPERMREIDAQIRELEGQRVALEEEAALAKARGRATIQLKMHETEGRQIQTS